MAKQEFKKGENILAKQGDNELMLKLIELAKKHGRENDVFVLNFSEGKGGSLNPETGEFAPVDKRN